jgi:hypothetical protein
MATAKRTTLLTTTADLGGRILQLGLDLTFGDGDEGDGRYVLNEDWKRTAQLSDDELASVQRWLDDVNDAGERLEHEHFLAQGLRSRFTHFMETQGFRAALHLDDGSRIFERDDQFAGGSQALVFRVLHGLEFEFKEVPSDVVEKTLRGDDGAKYTELAFDTFEGESRPLKHFLQSEGLSTAAQMTEELRAWRRVHESAEDLPSPVGIRARLAGRALGPDEQVSYAEAFARQIRERGFVRSGRHGDIPVHTWKDPLGKGPDHQILWRIGHDGTPRYKRFSERISDLPFGYDALDAREGDFATFLTQEKLSLERLPSGYPLALPFDAEPVHSSQIEYEAALPAGGPTTTSTEERYLCDRPAAVEAFLKLHDWDPVLGLADGTKIYLERDREIPWPTGDYYAVRGVNGQLVAKVVPNALVDDEWEGDRSRKRLPEPTFEAIDRPQQRLVHILHSRANGQNLPSTITDFIANYEAEQGSRRAAGRLTADQEFALGRQFQRALRDRGYRFHCQSEEGRPSVPVFIRRQEREQAEFLAWRMAEDGTPRFKKFRGEMTLDRAGGYEKLRTPEADFTQFLAEVPQHVQQQSALAGDRGGPALSAPDAGSLPTLPSGPAALLLLEQDDRKFILAARTGLWNDAFLESHLLRAIRSSPQPDAAETAAYLLAEREHPRFASQGGPVFQAIPGWVEPPSPDSLLHAYRVRFDQEGDEVRVSVGTTYLPTRVDLDSIPLEPLESFVEQARRGARELAELEAENLEAALEAQREGREPDERDWESWESDPDETQPVSLAPIEPSTDRPVEESDVVSLAEARAGRVQPNHETNRIEGPVSLTGDHEKLFAARPAALREFLSHNHILPGRVRLSDGTQFFELYEAPPVQLSDAGPQQKPAAGEMRAFAVRAGNDRVEFKVVDRDLVLVEENGERYADGRREPSFDRLPGKPGTLAELLARSWTTITAEEISSWIKRHEQFQAGRAASGWLTDEQVFSQGQAFLASLHDRGFQRAFYVQEYNDADPDAFGYPKITDVPVYERVSDDSTRPHEYVTWRADESDGVTYRSFTSERRILTAHDYSRIQDPFEASALPHQHYTHFLAAERVPLDRVPPGQRQGVRRAQAADPSIPRPEVDGLPLERSPAGYPMGLPLGGLSPSQASATELTAAAPAETTETPSPRASGQTHSPITWEAEPAFSAILSGFGYSYPHSLPDGARLYRRSWTEKDDPRPSQVIAVQFNPTGTIVWKDVNAAESQSLEQLAVPSFAALPDSPKDFTQFLRSHQIETPQEITGRFLEGLGFDEGVGIAGATFAARSWKLAAEGEPAHPDRLQGMTQVQGEPDRIAYRIDEDGRLRWKEVTSEEFARAGEDRKFGYEQLSAPERDFLQLYRREGLHLDLATQEALLTGAERILAADRNARHAFLETFATSFPFHDEDARLLVLGDVVDDDVGQRFAKNPSEIIVVKASEARLRFKVVDLAEYERLEQSKGAFTKVRFEDLTSFPQRDLSELFVSRSRYRHRLATFLQERGLERAQQDLRADEPPEAALLSQHEAALSTSTPQLASFMKHQGLNRVGELLDGAQVFTGRDIPLPRWALFIDYNTVVRAEPGRLEYKSVSSVDLQNHQSEGVSFDSLPGSPAPLREFFAEPAWDYRRDLAAFAEKHRALDSAKVSRADLEISAGAPLTADEPVEAALLSDDQLEAALLSDDQQLILQSQDLSPVLSSPEVTSSSGQGGVAGSQSHELALSFDCDAFLQREGYELRATLGDGTRIFFQHDWKHREEAEDQFGPWFPYDKGERFEHLQFGHYIAVPASSTSLATLTYKTIEAEELLPLLAVGYDSYRSPSALQLRGETSFEDFKGQVEGLAELLYAQGLDTPEKRTRELTLLAEWVASSVPLPTMRPIHERLPWLGQDLSQAESFAELLQARGFEIRADADDPGRGAVTAARTGNDGQVADFLTWSIGDLEHEQNYGQVNWTEWDPRSIGEKGGNTRGRGGGYQEFMTREGLPTNAEIENELVELESRGKRGTDLAVVGRLAEFGFMKAGHLTDGTPYFAHREQPGQFVAVSVRDGGTGRGTDDHYLWKKTDVHELAREPSFGDLWSQSHELGLRWWPRRTAEARSLLSEPPDWYRHLTPLLDGSFRESGRLHDGTLFFAHDAQPEKRLLFGLSSEENSPNKYVWTAVTVQQSGSYYRTFSEVPGGRYAFDELQQFFYSQQELPAAELSSSPVSSLTESVPVRHQGREVEAPSRDAEIVLADNPLAAMALAQKDPAAQVDGAAPTSGEELTGARETEMLDVSGFWRSPAALSSFLMAQRFEREGWLPDEAKVFFRPDIEEPMVDGLPAGELIAVRVDEQSRLRWKETDRDEISGATSYHDLKRPEQGLISFLRREGLQTTAGVQEEMRVWAQWQLQPERMPPVSIHVHLEQLAERGLTLEKLDRDLEQLSKFEISGREKRQQAYGLEGVASNQVELPDGSTRPARDDDQDTPAAYAAFERTGETPLPKVHRDREEASPAARVATQAPSNAFQPHHAEPVAGDDRETLWEGGYGRAHAQEELEDWRRSLAEAARVLGTTVHHTGVVTFGPELARTSRGDYHRVVLWSVDPATGKGTTRALMFDAPFAALELSRLRPGDFIAVDGFTRAAEQGAEAGASAPWQTWATSVLLPGGSEPVTPALSGPPPSDAVLRGYFSSPELPRAVAQIDEPATFGAAMRQPERQVHTPLKAQQLSQHLREYAQTRDLPAATEEILRFALSQPEPMLPASLVADLQAWADRTGQKKAFVFETIPAALERHLATFAAPDVASLEIVGIDRATLEEPQFRGLLRSSGDGLVALTSEPHGARGVVNTAWSRPSHSGLLLGQEDGIWLSAGGKGPCTKVVITQTPLLALAYHQRHPDPHARYLAVGGDELTLAQRSTLKQILAEIQRTVPNHKFEIVVTGHHQLSGQDLLHQVAALCLDHPLRGVLPPQSAKEGGWLEAARRMREPERRVNLPAYAEQRLGYEPLYRSPEGDQVIMGLRHHNIPREPLAASVPGAKRIRHRLPARPGPSEFAEKLAFVRQPDGSWRFQNDREHSADRGDAAELARTRLQMSLQEFRADVRRFEIEREFKQTKTLEPSTHDLNIRGIHPGTIALPCFRGTLRQDDLGRLVYPSHDSKGLCGFTRALLNDKVAGLRTDHLGTRGLWMSNPQDDGVPVSKIVIVDHPTTALAYHQQNPAAGVRYVATDGPSLTTEQSASLRWLLETASRERAGAGVEIIVAASRDRAGLEFSNCIAETLSTRKGVPFPVTRHTPAFGKDWNESVQRRERDFIRSIGSRQPEELTL